MISNDKVSMAEIEMLSEKAQKKIEELLLQNQLGLVTADYIMKEVERLLGEVNEKIQNAWD